MNRLGFSEIDLILNKLDTISPLGHSARKAMIYHRRDQLDALLDILSIQDYLVNNLDQSQIKSIIRVLKGIKDIRNSIRYVQRGGILSLEELFELKQLNLWLLELESLSKDFIEPIRVKGSQSIRELLDPRNEGLRTYYIYDCYSEELSRVRRDLAVATRKLEGYRSSLAKELIENLGIPLRTDQTIAISRDNLKGKEYLNCDKFTLTKESHFGYEYIYNPSDAERALEKEYETLKSIEEIEEGKVLSDLSTKIALHATEILSYIEITSRLDLELAKARYAMEQGHRRPSIIEDGPMILNDAHHPIVKEELKGSNLEYVRVSFELIEGVSVITGANMGGKSVNLRLAALVALMAGYGMYVPAEAEVPLFDLIYLSTGDHQRSSEGLSSFGGEMKDLASVLATKGKRLILLDELASGTNPSEGVIICRGIIEHLRKGKDIVFISSHYDGLFGIEGVNYLQVRGLKGMDYSKLQGIEDPKERLRLISEHMDYTLIKQDGYSGENVPRDALRIARAMGIDVEL